MSWFIKKNNNNNNFSKIKAGEKFLITLGWAGSERKNRMSPNFLIIIS